MLKKISLVIFNESDCIKWSFGDKFSLDYNTESLINNRDLILNKKSDFILFWDAKYKLPKESELENIYNSKGNLWHIGSKIGLKDIPIFLDAIQPTSMLHVSIDNSINHSSWKSTFKGCLLETNVFKEISLSNYSNSLDIVGLDFGYKAMKSGVLTRYSSILSSNIIEEIKQPFNVEDELLFIKNNFDKKAFFWSYLINLKKVNPFTFFRILKNKKIGKLNVYSQPLIEESYKEKDLSVSIVIATLERYIYLQKELHELKFLESKVREIIIVDQTPKDKRNQNFLEGFNDLPIKYIEIDKIGQCTARNKGIEKATSKFVWFLDDDMEEIPRNYLSKHLETIYTFNADISCGVPDEIGTDYVDRSIPKIELSDGFPTNDVLVKRELLREVGGFDEKMDQLQSEDQEIGLRCIKRGALSVKNNQLRIVHLRAIRGGLRKSNVRKITFASSRKNLFQRRYLHHSEIYLNIKHFSKKQIKNSIFLNIRGTFIVRGSFFKKMLKFILGVLLLPYTITLLLHKYNLAKKIYNEKHTS